MHSPPQDLLHKYQSAGQGHVFHGWEELSDADQSSFIQQLESIDLGLLNTLYQQRNTPAAILPDRGEIAALPVTPAESMTARQKAIGELALREGRVAVLVVAGGQGSRLGFEKPKGMFPVGPVSQSTLFRIHAEKVLALGRKYGSFLPFLIMTSSATHSETLDYFRSENYFGLHESQVHFFQQESMPALDLATGHLLLEKPGSLFLSPNGHGGTLTALADSGLLSKLKHQGIRHIYYLQVDNPLVNIAEPAFLGLHIEGQAEVSSKVVYKEQPGERVGILALVRERCSIIEYSDMPDSMKNERTPDGKLMFRAGNPAIHIFDVPFLERVTTGSQRLAYHIARKKVPHYDHAKKISVVPESENALKFELFIFDALPLAERWTAVQCHREDEFAPLKNASGADSLVTVHEAMLARSRKWLISAGINVPDQSRFEISPLFALEAEDLAGKTIVVKSGDHYLHQN